MKKEEFKKLVMPIIKECIKEALIEEGYLSKIVTEVLKGRESIVENKEKVADDAEEAPKQQSTLKKIPVLQEIVEEQKKNLEETRKLLKESASKSGFDPFKDTKPLPSNLGPEAGNSQILVHDPNDAGINIDGILKAVGSKWKKAI